MTDTEFVSLFRVEELPHCGTALLLLKKWIESDTQAAQILKQLETVDIQELLRRENPYFDLLVEHASQCQTCFEVLKI